MRGPSQDGAGSVRPEGKTALKKRDGERNGVLLNLFPAGAAPCQKAT
jgi:hypothetical protein